MGAKWVKFDGSDGKISEMMSAAHGFKFKRKDRNTEYHYTGMHKLDWSMVDSYMICQPHPHADMIIEWARTGREVYYFVSNEWRRDPFPTWQPNIKYSFNVPTESGENVNPSNISLPCDGDGK